MERKVKKNPFQILKRCKQPITNTHNMSSPALINRALTNVRTELDFLRESKVISEEAYNNILDQIPIKYDPNNAVNRPSPDNTNNKEYVEALYEFQPQQDGDLYIRPGDKIEVVEKPSPEWYKGKCNGNVGMFPSNYVKPLESAMVKVQPPSYQPPKEKPPQQYDYQYQQQQTQQYQPPYPPASTGYYQPQQVQQQPQQLVVQQDQQQQQHTGSSQLKKFGSKLGNAAIFGAGATLGSDLVNSIF